MRVWSKLFAEWYQFPQGLGVLAVWGPSYWLQPLSVGCPYHPPNTNIHQQVNKGPPTLMHINKPTTSAVAVTDLSELDE